MSIDCKRRCVRSRGAEGNQLICGADFDDFAWSTADRQIDGTAANAAVFDQILFALRSIDFQGKAFATNVDRQYQPAPLVAFIVTLHPTFSRWHRRACESAAA